MSTSADEILSIVAKFGDIHYQLYKRNDGNWMYRDMTTKKIMSLEARNSRTWAARRPKKKKRNPRLQKFWRQHKTQLNRRVVYV